MNDEHNDRPTRQEILDQYGWQPGEREAMQREQAERQARIDRERMLNEARQAEAARTAQPTAADAATIRERREAWQTYIKQEFDQYKTTLRKSIARAIVDEVDRERMARERAVAGEAQDRQKQCEDICRRFADHPRIEEFTRLRVKVASLEERLAALENAPAARTLKSVG